MNAKLNSSIFGATSRMAAGALLVMTILAGRTQGQYVSTLVSNGVSQPYGVTADNNDIVYISDTVNNRIAKITAGGTNFANLAGLTGPSYYGTNDGTGSAARFNSPAGIVFASARNALVVADEGNQELRLVTLAGVVSRLAGLSGVTGSNNGAALSATFNYPSALAVGPDGSTIYIVDQQNQLIRVLTSSNTVTNLNLGGYQFHGLAALAVDPNNNVYAADASDEVICLISSGVTSIIAGTVHHLGTNDSAAVGGAEFNGPNGLLWDTRTNALIVSDTHNDTLRVVAFTNGAWAVTTLAGTPQVGGFVDGALGTAEFRYPISLAVDLTDVGYYVADSGNNAIRVVQASQPPPPPTKVPDPVIGFLSYPLVGGSTGAQFNPITNPISIFNNQVQLVIEQTDATVTTYVTYGATGSSNLNTTTITPFYLFEVNYASNDVTATSLNSLFAGTPNVTLQTVSQASGRPSSDSVSAQIQFVTANPQIMGSDAADIVLSNTTVGAQMYYTLDGSTPTNDGTDGIGPVTSGTELTLNITSNSILSVRAFAPGFAPSGVSTELLTVSNFVGTQLTFGFSSGNSSSKFNTAAGRYYYAPITLSLLPGTTMYSFQFNVSETNKTPAIPIPSSTWEFDSYLRTPVTINGETFLKEIPPAIATEVTNGEFTNDNLIGIGWIEIYPETNLYPTISQDLITYSEAHDEEFTEGEGQVVVGALGFPIPIGATNGTQYTITLGLPSGTTYNPPGEIPQSVFIQDPTNGSRGAGAINSVKDVTVGVASYLVGDAYPFQWFNAGDFGDSVLGNSDVIEVFQTAVYGLDPVPVNSDFFDAMDSSGGTYNNLYDANDADINSIQLGDGQLLVDDVYVTFKRSLDTNLNWYIRNWSNGVETVTVFTNFSLLGAAHATTPVSAAQPQTNSSPVYITVAADQVQGSPGSTVQVPVRMWSVNTKYPLRVMMLDVAVQALDGSPAVTNGVTFTASSQIGSPTMTTSQSSADYGAAWLDSTAAGVTGTNIIGTVSVTLPPNAGTNAAYRIHFNSFSGSPNGLALFNSSVQDGLITTGSRTNSSWNDGIPDSWRLLYFGTVSNALSAANLDADGDGASNWAEYVAGTNPNDATSAFKFLPGATLATNNFTLQWTSVVSKRYTVQTCFNLQGGVWKTIATNIQGTGQPILWSDINASGQIQYYRAMVQ